MLEAFGLPQKKRRVAHDFMKTVPTNLTASKTFVCSGPNVGTNAQKTVASGANNSWQMRTQMSFLFGGLPGPVIRNLRQSIYSSRNCK